MTSFGVNLLELSRNRQESAGLATSYVGCVVPQAVCVHSQDRAVVEQAACDRLKRYPFPSPHFRVGGFSASPGFLCLPPLAKLCRSFEPVNSNSHTTGVNSRYKLTTVRNRGRASCALNFSSLSPSQRRRCRPVLTTILNAALQVLQVARSWPMSLVEACLPVQFSAVQQAFFVTTQASATKNSASQQSESNKAGPAAAGPVMAQQKPELEVRLNSQLQPVGFGRRANELTVGTVHDNPSEGLLPDKGSVRRLGNTDAPIWQNIRSRCDQARVLHRKVMAFSAMPKNHDKLKPAVRSNGNYEGHVVQIIPNSVTQFAA